MISLSIQIYHEIDRLSRVIGLYDNDNQSEKSEKEMRNVMMRN